EYALLARAAYDATMQEGLNKTLEGAGWILDNVREIEETGFRAITVVNADGEIAIVFAGTDDLKDVVEDARQAILGNGEQYAEAIAYAKKMSEKHGHIDRYVGHSLGGGLASTAAVTFHTPATTFNAAGIHWRTAYANGASLGNAENLVDAYRVRGEPLTAVQDSRNALG